MAKRVPKRKPSALRRNYWCFTTFKVDEFKVPEESPLLKYCIYQIELCPTTQKRHIQGYVEFTKQMFMNKIKQFFDDSTMHLEPRKGTGQEAKDYCTPDIPLACRDGKTKRECGEFLEGPWEYGTITVSEQGKRNDLINIYQDLLTNIQMSAILDKYPASFIRYHRGIIAANNVIISNKWKTCQRHLEVTVIFGDPGTGKTYYVFNKSGIEGGIYELAEPNDKTVWWDNYEGEQNLLIDEYNGWIKWSTFLRVLDIYPLKIAVKGGHTYLGITKIFITSNMDPNAWYASEPQRNNLALFRRLHNIVRFNKFDELTQRVDFTVIKGTFEFPQEPVNTPIPTPSSLEGGIDIYNPEEHSADSNNERERNMFLFEDL